MIVNCLIKRVEVCRDYKLRIDFNIDLEQFAANFTQCGIKQKPRFRRNEVFASLL